MSYRRPRGPIKLRKKSQSRLMRFVAALPFVPPSFMSAFWTTIGHSIYAPTVYDRDTDWGHTTWLNRHKEVLDHEGVHVAQVETWGHTVHTLLYLGPAPFLALLALLSVPLAWFVAWWIPLAVIGVTLLSMPLSLGLAWGRWRIEREAYMVQLSVPVSRVDAEIQARRIVESLWNNYAYTWPRAWAWAWFKRQIERGK